MWLARDKDGVLLLWYARPIRDGNKGMFVPDLSKGYDECFLGINEIYFDSVFLKRRLFPEVTWENSPIELVTKL